MEFFVKYAQRITRLRLRLVLNELINRRTSPTKDIKYHPSTSSTLPATTFAKSATESPWCHSSALKPSTTSSAPAIRTTPLKLPARVSEWDASPSNLYSTNSTKRSKFNSQCESSTTLKPSKPAISPRIQLPVKTGRMDAYHLPPKKKFLREFNRRMTVY